MKKYLVEFIGTFFLVFTIGNAAVYGGVAMAPLAIGVTLAVMIYAGGWVSGGHFNPAVTLGAFLRGACPAKDVAPYMGAQVVGGVLASLVAGIIHSGKTADLMTIPVVPALLAEFLFAFALVYVVLMTATVKSVEGNSYYGLAIGGTVLAGAFAVGGISGGAFNPAVAISLCVMGVVGWSSIWIYLVANFAGGALAALVFKTVAKS